MSSAHNEPPRDEPPPPSATALPWPPPGLEPLQNRFAALVAASWLGALLFTIPLLLKIGRDTAIEQLRIERLLTPLLITYAGVALLVLAALRVLRFAFACARAARLGYGAGTILGVAADHRHDTGLLINGTQVYDGFAIDARKQLQVVRIVAPLLLLAAAWWLPIGSAFGMSLAALGALQPVGFWILVAGPAVLLSLGALFLRSTEGSLVQQAHKNWSTREALREAISKDASAWRKELEDSNAIEVTIGPTAHFPRAVLIVLALALLGGALALTVLPRRSWQGADVTWYVGNASDPYRLANDYSALDLYRPYVIAPDSSATPEQAGHALATLLSIAGTEPIPGLPVPDFTAPAFLRPPDRVLPTPLPGQPYRRQGVLPQLYSGRVFPLAKASLNAQQRASLDTLAAYPVQDEIRTIVAAPGIDIVGTRWITPFPDSATMLHLRSTRSARESLTIIADIMIARAALQFESGDVAGAERSLRELMTVGFRFADDSPIAADLYAVGTAIGRAADALLLFFRAAGRSTDAAMLEVRIRARQSGRQYLGYTPIEEQAGEYYLSMGRGRRIPEAMRWTTFVNARTLSRCGNAHRVLFRALPEDTFRLRRAREELVEYPADAALFDVMKKGLLDMKPGRECQLPPEAQGFVREALRELRSR